MIDKSPWLPFEEDVVHRIPDAVGVFELGDIDKQVIFLGCADNMLLRERLLEMLEHGDKRVPPAPHWFRYEETHKPHLVFRSIVRGLREQGRREVRLDV